MTTEQIVLLCVVIGILVLSLGLHECAHAGVAYLRGDDTAKRLGRLTPNPIVHIDPFMTILLPALLFVSTNGSFVFGGAKAVPVVPSRLKHPLRDMMWVALAGPATNLVLAFLFMMLWKASTVFWGYDDAELLPQALYLSALYNILLTIFNMLPIPPLDGSRVMAYVMPESLREGYVALERFGLILVVAVIFVLPRAYPPAAGWLPGAMDAVEQFIYDLTGGDWRRFR